MTKDKAQEDFRDSVSTMDQKGKRLWIFAQKPKGLLFNKRKVVSIILLTIMFVLPFIKYQGEPLLLFNIFERKFILFGVIFWPQDFFLLGLGMLAFMVFIVLFTVVFGRLWCGWACPQTIFMEMIFRRIEYLIEGDASKQRQLNKGPWTSEKIIKKTSKHILFFLISLIIATILLSFIISIDEVKIMFNNPSENIKALVSLILFTGVFYFVFAWFREQVCTVVCPYGRLQGVLLDKNSVVVAYDYLRGEPRGKFSKKENNAQGDCIDCFQCVKVCPTGIDIRNGTQLECINCTACIDACDFMMEKTGKEKGLIRFASETNIAEGKKFQFTPRIKGYTAVLSILVIGLSFLLFNRSEIETTVMRTPGMLYQEQENNKVSNLYNIKIVNKTRKSIPTHLKVESISGDIKMIGRSTITVNSGSVAQGEFFIILDRSELTSRKTKIKIGVYSGSIKLETIETSFLGPVSRTGVISKSKNNETSTQI